MPDNKPYQAPIEIPVELPEKIEPIPYIEPEIPDIIPEKELPKVVGETVDNYDESLNNLVTKYAKK